ncbi:MAG: hypothetical protein ACLU9T_19740 [Blautia faecis]
MFTKSFSLGIGKDGVAGYPLINAYLTGKELKLAAESETLLFPRFCDNLQRLYCSGLNSPHAVSHRMIREQGDGLLSGPESTEKAIENQ